MKRATCLILLFISILTLSACDSSVMISGLENFSENTCAFGLNDGLLPNDTQFISSYNYEDGIYYYWTDGNYLQAKTIVRLSYSESSYYQAKERCQTHYTFLSTNFNYKNFVFSDPITDDSEYNFRGVQMCGYDDHSKTLIFIGYINYASDKYETITESNFIAFFEDEFGEYLTKIGDGSLS